MRHSILLAILLWPTTALADVRFPHSIGGGTQYGGIIGWQGRLSGERIHGRLALGWLGGSAGVDVVASEHFLLGLTRTEVIFFSLTGVSFTYVPGGDYAKGWRFALDVGRAQEATILADRPDPSTQTGISIGYAF